MTVLQAIALGILQGLTEFLPVSSSGHLVIAQHYLKGFNQPGVLFDVLLHMGTLFAVLMYYWRDIIGILRSFITKVDAPGSRKNVDCNSYDSQRKLGLLIIVGTIPTAILGFFFKDYVVILFSSVKLTACMLIVTGILLAIADRVKERKRKVSSLTFKDSVFIGFVQGLSITPGISRSGSTIATGLFRKIDGKDAAKFSFLLSIPAVLGAIVLEIPQASHIQAGEIPAYLLGTLSAMLTGILAIKFLIRTLKQEKLRYFAYYCWLLGSVVIAFG
ncbi:MAG: undecaprenyl-diphosphatase UppP [Thermodesulfobacteriota bacterium]